jgi:serine/threonine protein kinase
MKETTPSGEQSRPVSSDLLVDRLCDEFEDAWKYGLRPRIEEYLDRIAPDLRAPFLRELVAIEAFHRRSRGDEPSYDEYRRRFPDLPESMLTAIYAPADYSAADGDAGPPTMQVLPGARVESTAPTPVLDTLPARIGDYELLGEVARGGMGVVYRARQTSLNRIVALKLIRSGTLASDKEFQRFQIEAEACASLDHPHIVPVYETGTHEGQRFLAMKLVEGGSLATRVSEYSLTKVDGSTTIGSRVIATAVPDARRRQERIAHLLSRVAHAVHYAHQHGILHRDLKPSNILLDSAGTPFVGDFGLAKRVGVKSAEDTIELTLTGMVVGTPNYMAPEQARGEKGLTTAVDVHALGAVLYELLTGELPFRAPTPLQTLQRVASEEPIPPRQRQPEVSVDLETICLKCLHKDPQRRYASAEELAQDLTRFEQGEPILARPVSSWERARRWCRRNSAVSTLAATAALLLLAVTGVSIRSASVSRQAAADLAIERDAKDRESQDALAARDRARRVIEFMSSWEWLDRLARQPELTPDETRLLSEIVSYYEEYTAEEAPTDAERQRRAEALLSMGRMLATLGRSADAEAAYRKSISRFEQLRSEGVDDPKLRNYLSTAMINLGILLHRRNESNEALTMFAGAKSILRKLHDEFPDRPAYELDLGNVEHNLGLVAQHLGNRDDARLAFETAAQIKKRTFVVHPDELVYVIDLAKTQNSLGLLLMQLNERDQAIKAFDAAVELLQATLQKYPDDADLRWTTGEVHRSRGYCRRLDGEQNRARGDLKEALRDQSRARSDYEEAHRILKPLVRQYPRVPEFTHCLAKTHSDFAYALYRWNEHDASRSENEAAAKIFADLVNRHPRNPEFAHDFAQVYQHRGRLLQTTRDLDGADDAFALAIKFLQELVHNNGNVPAYKATLGAAYRSRGNIERERRHYAPAIDLYDRAIEILTGLNHPNATDFLRNAYVGRAQAFDLSDRPRNAATDWERAIELSEGNLRSLLRVDRARSTFRAGDVGSAIAEADEVARIPQLDTRTAYELACFYVLAMSAPNSASTKSLAGDPADLNEAHAKRAIGLLQHATSQGQYISELSTNSALATLRDRKDFQELVKKLGGSKPADKR